MISEETRQKLRLAKLGKKQSPEVIAKRAAAMRGHAVSEEARRNMSLARIGKRLSEETKRKLSLANLGKKLSAESIAKRSAAVRGRKRSFETRRKMSIARKGFKHSEETKRKLSLVQIGKPKMSLRGRIFSAEHREKLAAAKRGRKQTKEQCEKRTRSRAWYKHSEATRRKISALKPKGADSPLWKGGVTPLNRKIRESVEYKLWRTAVFKRDDFTCQHCGVRGGRLDADHIKPFSVFHDLRFDVANGRTLCRPCHDEIGWRPGRPIPESATA